MNNCISAAELAELNLPNLPTTRQAVDYKAKKENWVFEIIKGNAGRGGRARVYPIDRLPADIQAAIREKYAAEAAEQPSAAPVPARMRPAVPVAAVLQGLNDARRDCAYARMSLVAEVLKLHRIHALPLKRAIAELLRRIEVGEVETHLAKLVPVANARSGGAVKLSARSLLEWTTVYQRAADANERLALLAPRSSANEKPIYAYAWLPDFMRFHCIPTAPKLAHSYREFAGWWQQSARPDLPSLSMVKRVWMKLPETMRERGRKTGAAYKSLLPYVKRDWSALRVNDVWIGDGHSFKAKVAHPVHGRPFKPEVTVIIDGCSRVVVGFSVSLAENCIAVADALRIGMKHFGLPLMYYSDNGGGQTAKTIDHEITGITARLGIHHETGLPGNPQGRGIIEGWWQNNLIRIARRYETFTGSGMDSSTKNLMYRKMESAFNARENGKELTEEQRRYAAKLPRWEQFIADIAACIDDYNTRPHSQLPKTDSGERFTPLAYRAYRLERDGFAVEMLSETELTTMFMPQVVRKVQRGWIDLFNNQYFSMELADYNKTEVRVAYDLDDATNIIVYGMDGDFIAKAVLNGNKRDAFPIARRDQLAEKRAQGRIKRAENIIKLANAEKNPALEQAETFDELYFQPRETATVPRRVKKTGTDDDDIVLFKADL